MQPARHLPRIVDDVLVFLAILVQELLVVLAIAACQCQAKLRWR